MGRNDTTSAVVDGVLKLILTASTVGSVLVAPNALIAFDKPLRRIFDKLDSREREREMRRVIKYMKWQGLINGDYDHGLQITKRGRKRLDRVNIETITIDRSVRCDKKWRLVLYDLPKRYKVARTSVPKKLRELGFYQLQRSVWIFPHECRKEIEAISSHYKVYKYVSYIETGNIDNESLLKKKFRYLRFSS